MINWREVATTPIPNDGELRLYALKVVHMGSETSETYWAFYALSVDEEGDLRETSWDYFSDWQLNDFTHWTPMSEPSETPQ